MTDGYVRPVRHRHSLRHAAMRLALGVLAGIGFTITAQRTWRRVLVYALSRGDQ